MSVTRAPFILTPQEVRVLNRHPKAVVNRLRVLAGDRKESKMMFRPNATDEANGHVMMTDDDRKIMNDAVDKLIAKLGE